MTLLGLGLWADIVEKMILRITDATSLRHIPDLPLTHSRHVLPALLDIILCEDNLSLIWEP